MLIVRGEPDGKSWEVHELVMVVDLALSANFGSEKGKKLEKKE